LPPPARSPLRNLMPTISAQPAEADPPPKTLGPLQQCAHVRDRVGIVFQAVRILFGLQFNLQPDAVRIVEVEGLAIPSFDNFGYGDPWSLSVGRRPSRSRCVPPPVVPPSAFPKTNLAYCRVRVAAAAAA